MNPRDLPVWQLHFDLLRTLRDGNQLVLVGATGSGKTTQLPQMLLDGGLTLEWSVAGEGPLSSSLQATSTPCGSFLGRRDDMPSLLARHDVVVMTSRREGEGMPGILIEAGMAGCAVVTTDVPGARDVIAHGESGFVVPIDPIEPLVAALAELAAEVTAATRMGEAGRRRCISAFSVASVSPQWAAALSTEV